MIYVVQPGDTLYSLSRRFGTSVREIAWLNQIPDPNVLVAGQALLILDGSRTGPFSIQVNGFAYPFISPWVLNETLSNLNLLSVFSYGFTPDGDLLPPLLNDRWMVERASARGVGAALVLTPLDRTGQFSNYLISGLLASPPAQEKLLEQIRQTMDRKGFAELNIDFEYILPQDRDRFTDFVRLAAQRLEAPVTVCLAPKSNPNQRGPLFDGKDFPALGEAADRVLLMTYEWGTLAYNYIFIYCILCRFRRYFRSGPHRPFHRAGRTDPQSASRFRYAVYRETRYDGQAGSGCPGPVFGYCRTA